LGIRRVWEPAWNRKYPLSARFDRAFVSVFRLSEAVAKNREKDDRLTKLDGVLRSLENKVPTKASIDAIKEKAAQVGRVTLFVHFCHFSSHRTFRRTYFFGSRF
jgi:hypothetical protein